MFACVRRMAGGAVAMLMLSGCIRSATPVPDPALQAIAAAVSAAVAQENVPGGVFLLSNARGTFTHAAGLRATHPSRERVTEDTIYDLASLTKVIATAPSIVLLIQDGKLELDAPAARYLPEFSGDGRELVTLRHLLTHYSGLAAGLPRATWSGYEAGAAAAIMQIPQNTPGAVFRYSDVNFIILGEIVRRVSGESLDVFAARRLFQPLEMRDTSFNPSRSVRSRIAPTEVVEGSALRGVVHDPLARRMGGVAGHAGLFGTAADVARFSRMLLAGGVTSRGQRLFSAEAVNLLTTSQIPAGLPVRRTLGFDIDSRYSRPKGGFSADSFGHTGYTGTFLWIDPAAGAFYVFLSNRVHPADDGSVVPLQRTLGMLAAAAAGATREGDAATVSWPNGGVLVETGIDRLKLRRYDILQGRRVALVTNHTGRDRDGNATIDLLRSSRGVQLVALFAPEHGIRGEKDEKIVDGVDVRSGIPVYSLYDDTTSPRPEELSGVDAVVFDIQDIGTRYYTYAWTLRNVMRAAAAGKAQMIVLDRPNPINGESVEGPSSIEREIPSAFHPMPIRHGLTLGELALMLDREQQLGAQPEVVRMTGWQRSLYFDRTDLRWIDTSPNMRNMNAALLYPGVGMIETAKISVGRGTDMPLEIVGAPYVKGEELAAALRGAGLAGVDFHAIAFTPSFREFRGERCEGVRIEVVDRDAVIPTRVGLVLAVTLHRLYGDRFDVRKANLLLQDTAAIDSILAGADAEEVIARWEESAREFRVRRAQFLLY